MYQKIEVLGHFLTISIFVMKVSALEYILSAYASGR